MPGNPPPVKTESEALIAYLVQQRDGLRYAAFGLTDAQIRLQPTRSSLTIGGLIKHALVTERGWTDLLLGGKQFVDEHAYADTFTLTDSETLVSLIAEFDQVAADTEAAVASLASMDVAVQLPDAPWYPKNPAGYSARWVLLHLIEELARHAGHADLIREHIDGATMYELMAGAEGWPESDWIKPWKPATGRRSSG